MKLIVGNWKMYPKTFNEAKRLLTALGRTIGAPRGVKVVVCPPMPYLGAFRTQKQHSKILFGAQNAFWEDEGARTGEISPAMLRSLGVSHVIVGHSERRALGETNEMIARKAQAAVRNKLTVVLCVGEKDRDHGGAYFAEVRDQLLASLSQFPRKLVRQLVIAYEPIWAIGSGAKKAASPADFSEMKILIRRHLVEYFGKKAGFTVPIIYGGSVDDQNAAGFLSEGGADGLLPGRVSLDPMKFASIIRIARAHA